MKVLVTGATGFVGGAVVKRLLRENVWICASILEGEDAGHLPVHVEQVVVDPLSGETDWSGALGRVDVVIHLAARVHLMRDAAADPLQEFRRVNLHGTGRLARQAAEAGVKRLVYVSTVKVHGEETEVPYRDDSPVRPLDPYGRSKAEAEKTLREISSETGLEVVVVRPPLVYGPGVKANFRQLMRIISRGVALPFAGVANRRSLVYVENLADALVRCAFHPDAAGMSYLVSDGDDVSTPELITRIGAALATPAILFSFPVGLLRLTAKVVGKSDSLERLVGSLTVDSSRISSDLGWAPPFSMTQGLEQTARWFNETIFTSAVSCGREDRMVLPD